MGKEQLELLDKYGVYITVPKGISMRPMLMSPKSAAEVRRLAEPAKRYDLVMYVRENYQGVIHRVVRAYPDHYVIIGDNCWQLEYVKAENVKGIVTKFYRNGRWYDIDNRFYRLYVHLWVDFLFIRRPLFWFRDRVLKRIYAKLKRLVKHEK